MDLNPNLDSEEIKKVLANFGIPNFRDLYLIGEGLINESVKVDCDESSFILQKLNNKVFKKPEALVHNYTRLHDYLQNQKLQIQIPELISNIDGDYLFQNSSGSIWRLIEYIPHKSGINQVENRRMAYSMGMALSEFHLATKNLNPDDFMEPIPDFHNTSKRYNDFEAALFNNSFDRHKIMKEESEFLLSEKDFVLTKKSYFDTILPKRIVHQDTKLNNFLFDENNEIIAIIDFDTLGPGYLYYDIGDAIRSSMSNVSEDSEEINIELNKSLLKTFIDAYMEISYSEIDETELGSFLYAPLILTFEQALRFAEDFLRGDVYFKVQKKDHNLIRLRNQIGFYKVLKTEFSNYQEILGIKD